MHTCKPHVGRAGRRERRSDLDDILCPLTSFGKDIAICCSNIFADAASTKTELLSSLPKPKYSESKAASADREALRPSSGTCEGGALE